MQHQSPCSLYKYEGKYVLSRCNDKVFNDEHSRDHTPVAPVRWALWEMGNLAHNLQPVVVVQHLQMFVIQMQPARMLGRRSSVFAKQVQLVMDLVHLDVVLEVLVIQIPASMVVLVCLMVLYPSASVLLERLSLCALIQLRIPVTCILVSMAVHV